MATRNELRTWLEGKRDMALAGADATFNVAASDNYQRLADTYQDVLDKLDQLEHGCAATQMYGPTGCS